MREPVSILYALPEINLLVSNLTFKIGIHTCWGKQLDRASSELLRRTVYVHWHKPPSGMCPTRTHPTYLTQHITISTGMDRTLLWHHKMGIFLAHVMNTSSTLGQSHQLDLSPYRVGRFLYTTITLNNPSLGEWVHLKFEYDQSKKIQNWHLREEGKVAWNEDICLLLYGYGYDGCRGPCCVIIHKLGCWVWVLVCDS